MSSGTPSTPFTTALVAGGVAGTSVDVILFPIDTIKTRLQARGGLARNGGFSGIWRGLGAAAAGAAPCSALFFGTYELSKARLAALQGTEGSGEEHWFVHSTSASLGEVIACMARVPTEAVKQRMQVSAAHKSWIGLGRQIWRTHGISGFYVGYGTTVAREVPFAFIQFPIYERLKRRWSLYQGGEETSPLQGAACGSFAGAVAGGLTTPFDVVKTRLMTQDPNQKTYEDAMMRTMRTIGREEGLLALFSGVGPRVGWIACGGFVFFGAYEGSKRILAG